jgi:hypothetical protein
MIPDMTRTLRRRTVIRAGTTFGCLAVLPLSKAFGAPPQPILHFLEQDFVLRAEQNDDFFIFTPPKQADLQTRTDMFSITAYQDVQNYTQLQAQKNKVLDTYKHPGAVIFTENDAPPSSGFNGECLFVVGEGGQDYTDASFARFTLASGIGYALVYTRSFYDSTSPGGDSAKALGGWLNAHGGDTAKALLDFTIVLNPDILRGWAAGLTHNAG